MSIRAKIIFAFCLLLVGCSTPDEVWISTAQRPITVVALSDVGSVLLRDSRSKHRVFPPGYAITDAIKDSYAVGDTLK